MGEITEYYFTTTQSVTTELKEKGSRFIAYLRPVQNQAEAEAFISEISKQHYDATHNCYAWRLGLDQHESIRFNDDGEPSGTAGKPILQAINGHDLTNVAVVVTRYFGGTKLGTGGLVRAYGGAASAALEMAKRRQVYLTREVALSCNYSFLKTVFNKVEQLKGRIIESTYADQVQLVIELRLRTIEPFIQYITNQSAGTITPTIID